MATQSIWGNDAIGGAKPWQMQAMGSPSSSPWTQQLGDQSGMWGSPAAGQSPFSGMFSGGNSAQPASGDNPWASLMSGPSGQASMAAPQGGNWSGMPWQQPSQQPWLGGSSSGENVSMGLPGAGGIWGGSSTQQIGGSDPWASLMGGASSNPWDSYQAASNPSYSTGLTGPTGPSPPPPVPPPPAKPPIKDPEGNTNHDSQNITQISSIKPWAPQGAALEDLYKKAQGNYADLTKQGPIGFDRASTVGLDRMQRLAGGPNALVDSATGAVGDIASGKDHLTTGAGFGQIAQGPGISTGGFTSLFNNPGVGVGKFNQLYNQNANGQGQLSQGIFGNIAQGGQLSSYPQYAPTYDEMGTAIADPRMAGVPPPASDPNPYRAVALDNALKQAANQTKAGLSAAGRYGSSAYGDAMGKALGDTATTFNLNAYNADQDRMMQAAQAASNEQLARQGLGMQAAQGVSAAQGQNAATKLAAIQGSTGVQNQNTQNRLAALAGQTGVQGQNIGNQLQAAGMAPAMNDLRYADSQRLIGVGGAREEQAKQAQMFNTQNLQQMAGMFGSLPGAAGVTQNSQPPTPWWQQLLGGGLAGLGALGQIKNLF